MDDFDIAATAVARAAVAYFKALELMETRGPAGGRADATGAAYKTLREATDRFEEIDDERHPNQHG